MASTALRFPSSSHPPPHPPPPPRPPPRYSSAALLCPSLSPSLPPSSASSRASASASSASPLSSPHPSESPFLSSPSSPSSPSPQALHPHQLSVLHRGHPDCEELNLAGNRLASLCSFHLFASLQLLDLSSNRLTSTALPHLASLQRLSSLSLAHNGLSSLHNLPALPALRDLDVQCNALVESTVAVDISRPLTLRCPSLQRLALQGNPFYPSDAAQLRRLVALLRPLRRLHTLDGLSVDAERGAGEPSFVLSVEAEEDGHQSNGSRDGSGDVGHDGEDAVEEEEEEEEEEARPAFRGPTGTAVKAVAQRGQREFDPSEAVPFLFPFPPPPTTREAVAVDAADHVLFSSDNPLPRSLARRDSGAVHSLLRPWDGSAAVVDEALRSSAVRRPRSPSDALTASALRVEVSALKELRKEEEEGLSAAVGVEAKGLSLWRQAMCRLLVRLRAEEESRERLRSSFVRFATKAKAESAAQERRAEALSRQVDAERAAAREAQEEVARVRAEQWALHRRMEEEGRQQLQRQRGGFREATAAMQSQVQRLQSAMEELAGGGTTERRMADFLDRLHFASQRLQMLSHLTALQQRRGGGKEDGMAPPPFLSQSGGGSSTARGEGPLSREVERLRQDRALLLAEREAADRLLKEETGRLQRRVEELLGDCQQLREAKEAADERLNDSRTAVAHVTAEKVKAEEAMERMRAEAEADASHRVERLKAELQGRSEEREALQRENVALTVEVRALQRAVQAGKERWQRDESERWREYEEQIRSGAERLQRCEREKEEVQRRWRRLLPQHLPMHPSVPPPLQPPQSAQPPQVQQSSEGSSASLPLTSRIQSLAQLSHQLLHDDD